MADLRRRGTSKRRVQARALGAVLLFVVCLVAVGCRPAIPADAWDIDAPVTGTYAYFESHQPYGSTNVLYTQVDAGFGARMEGSQLQVGVSADLSWTGFVSPPAGTVLERGYYDHATRIPEGDLPGLFWGNGTVGCSSTVGWFGIDALDLDSAGQVALLDMRFELYCDRATEPLRGKIHFDAADPTAPRGPVTPIPDDRWRAPASAVPPAGNYVYLESSPNDWIGQGHTYLYTQSNAVLRRWDSYMFALSVSGDQGWDGQFAPMAWMEQIQPGLYPDIATLHNRNPTSGYLRWGGQGRGCNGEGWFIVDQVSYVAGKIQSIDLRFEQICSVSAGPLHGQLHWSDDDPTPIGPAVPVPADLWRPASDAVPGSGNYVYLVSESGDEIGAGREHLFTQANAVLDPTVTSGAASVKVTGDERWSGSFKAMAVAPSLRPGYYGLPVPNPILGGPLWTGAGRTCSTATGWFAVDNLVVTNGTLEALDVRFEQRCNGSTAALHGQIHWASGDPTNPPGPIDPAPLDLWSAPPEQLPTSGNYFYLQSDPGDLIGSGTTQLITSPASFDGGAFESTLAVRATLPDHSIWMVYLVGMTGQAGIRPGLYGHLSGLPPTNPTRGGMDVVRSGGSCTTASGWVVVDQVTITGTSLTSVDLRFEHRCNGAAAALRGQVHVSLPG